MNRNVGIIVAVIVVGIIALIAYSTVAGARYRVKVCMTYKGRTECRTVSSHTEEGAVRGATTNACADIASGVTETMGCEHVTPDSITWLERPGN
ncbi:MAG: hypothetical protein WBW33_19255 [Bryobacteraceae bacterium]